MGADLQAPTAETSRDWGVTPPPLRALLGYFLRLGALGFGGPIALAGAMQRDLVEERRWIAREEYVEGLALAQLAPGPLAAQLAIYLGWVRGGFVGATLTGIAFVLPSFVMVLALAALYVHAGELAWLRSVFYGVGASVIAIIGRSATRLSRTTLSRDPLLWALAAVSAIATAWTESESVPLFVACGLVSLVVRAPPRAREGAGVWIPPMLLAGLHGVAAPETLWQLLGYFAQAGAVVFGSGLAIVPFLRSGVVERFHWLTDRQFLDAVAVAMITPGPVVITVAFIGYLVAGPLGALAASVGVFVPCYLLVVLLAPHFHRVARSPRIKAFVSGVTAAATGAIAGAAFVLGRRAIIDLPTAVIALSTLAALSRWKKLPEPVVIAAAGAAGVVAAQLHGR